MGVLRTIGAPTVSDRRITFLNLYNNQGQLFLTPVELRQRAEQEKSRADRLAAKLKSLGEEPEEVEKTGLGQDG